MSDKGTASEQRGSGLLPVGIILGLLAVAAVFLSLRAGDAPDANDVTGVVEAVVPAKAPSPEATSDTAQAGTEAAQATADATPVETAAPPVPEAATDASAGTAAPTIDEVRVDNDGLVVVAGRGTPGSKVDVLVDGEVVSSAEVDASGAFAALGTVDASTGARSLTLQSGTGDEAVASAEEIILAPTGPVRVPASEAAQAQPSGTEPETIADAQTADQEQVSDQVALPAPANVQTTAQAAEAGPATVAVDPGTPAAQSEEEVRQPEETTLTAAGDAVSTTAADPAGAALVADAPTTGASAVVAPVGTSPDQPASSAGASQAASVAAVSPPAPEQSAQQADALTPPAGAEATGQIAVLRSDAEGVRLQRSETGPTAQVMLDTIGYNDAGDVQLSGRAGPEAVEVRVYLDNRGVGRLPVDAGVWQGIITGVEPGVYRLRIDAMSAGGTVSSRIETPFKREAPAVLTAATETNEAAGSVRAVTVQAGDTLWAIARDRYGEGILYVQVFEANRDSIRDPDLIYPGQIFDLPGD